MPKMLAEFLVYLEAENVYHVHDIQETHLKAYLNYLYERPNYKWDGGLSKNYIRKQVQVIKKFSRYLTESGQESFVVKLRIKGKSSNVKGILTRLEIKRLYDATEDNVMGLRDRVILALYYGCGLRKNEGINVNVSDVLLDKDMIYVRKGKGYKERYVPLNAHIKTDLENYIHLARPYLTDDKKKDDALLLSIKGKRLKGFTAYKRVQELRLRAMIDKAVGLHSLRHSIATHLLESGMKLEHIQHFLGHSSLESTQIYTHLIHEQV
jgi:site-specific recombinase XerD